MISPNCRKFKWLWSPADSYEPIGRSVPTKVDALGLTTKSVLEALDRVDSNVQTLKDAVEAMYNNGVSLVNANKSLKEEITSLREKVESYEHK